MTILVTGSNGLVGSYFVSYFRSKVKKEQLFTPPLQELDVTEKASVKRCFNTICPNVLVHFAAFTDVNSAENERNKKDGLAWRTNVLGTKNIVELCRSQKLHLIHISTDGVFSGLKEKPGPYGENDPIESDPNKLSWYGWTKAQAEIIVSKNLLDASIVRISYPVRAHFKKKLDYVRKILFLFDRDEFHPMFTDQYLTLTFINEVSEVITRLILTKKSGIFHVSSKDTFTPFELACYLLERTRGVKNVVQPISLEEFVKRSKMPARYPQFGGLKTEKTQRALGINFLDWKEIIDALIKEGVTY